MHGVLLLPNYITRDGMPITNNTVWVGKRGQASFRLKENGDRHLCGWVVLPLEPRKGKISLRSKVKQACLLLCPAVFGEDTTASGSDSLAMGYGAKASGTRKWGQASLRLGGLAT